MRGPRRPRPQSPAVPCLRVNGHGWCVCVCGGGGCTRVTGGGTCSFPPLSAPIGWAGPPLLKAPGATPRSPADGSCRAAAGRHSPSSTLLSTLGGSAVRLLGCSSSSPPSAGAAGLAGPSRRAASPPAANFCTPPASVRRWAPAAPSFSTAGRLKHRRMLSMPGRERPFTSLLRPSPLPQKRPLQSPPLARRMDTMPGQPEAPFQQHFGPAAAAVAALQPAVRCALGTIARLCARDDRALLPRLI
jgi:hypothetical protein